MHRCPNVGESETEKEGNKAMKREKGSTARLLFEKFSVCCECRSSSSPIHPPSRDISVPGRARTCQGWAEPDRAELTMAKRRWYSSMDEIACLPGWINPR